MPEVPVYWKYTSKDTIQGFVSPDGELIAGQPATYSADSSNNPIGIVNPNGGLSAFSSLYQKLIASFNNAKGKHPFDYLPSATQPLVSAVTVNAAALSTPVTYGYYDAAGGYDRIRMSGIPYKDTSLMSGSASGAVAMTNPSGTTGSGYAGMATAQNQLGTIMMKARVTCATCQISLESSGLSSNYFPVTVNGVLVAPAVPAAVTAGTSGNIQIAFAVRGTYDITVGCEQSAFVRGVTVDVDDTVHPLITTDIPVVMYGDSYTAGVVSPATVGNIGLANAISMIGGINCMAHGASGTGYVNDSGQGFPMTFAGRMQYIAAIANASNAPLIIIPAGYNDVSIPVNTANQQAAATTLFNYLLANTTANIIAFGAQSGNRNNSANMVTADLGVKNAVTAINNNRLAFVPVGGASAPWIIGTRYTAVTTGGVTGNSRYYTGNDGIHPSPMLTAGVPVQSNLNPSSGVEYLARKIIDAIIQTSLARNW